jgi:hypothetical protein
MGLQTDPIRAAARFGRHPDGAESRAVLSIPLLKIQVATVWLSLPTFSVAPHETGPRLVQ